MSPSGQMTAVLVMSSMLILAQYAAPTVHAAGCFFPAELQGTYVTQQTSSIIPAAFSTAEAAAAASAAAHVAGADAAAVRYSTVNITPDAIPIWGQCHRRIGHNVILQIDSDDSECYRCLQLRLLTRNVLRVRTADSDYIAKCYTNEAKAMATCPGAATQTAQASSSRRRRRSTWMDGGDFDEDDADYAEEYALEDAFVADDTTNPDDEKGDDWDDLDGEQNEIILYKTLDFDGQTIRREFCPIDGRYRAVYNVLVPNESDDEAAAEDRVECPSGDSQLDNCPSGSTLNLRFRKCSFEDHEITYECLGHWIGAGGQRFVALMNTRLSTSTDNAQRSNGSSIVDNGPQYRCATYHIDSSDATTSAAVFPATVAAYTITFSNDSTCASLRHHRHNHHHQDPQHPINRATVATTTMKMSESYQNSQRAIAKRTETLHLYGSPVAAYWPHAIFCSFPDWMRGRWQHMDIDQSTVVYRDHSSFKTYTMRCVENEIGSERFLLFSRTQCGEETYRCVWATRRAPNVLEFQIGARTAPNATMDICDDRHFGISTHWLTQARLGGDLFSTSEHTDNAASVEPCPVRGEFQGRIPDAEGLCAQLASDCGGSPDRMHYQVSECDGGVVYEERQYRCLGQWQENGLVYTYAQRTDVHQHQFECFVGGFNVHPKAAALSNSTATTLFIKEAGEHCQRHMDPFHYGMELHQVAYCSPDGGGSGAIMRSSAANDVVLAPPLGQQTPVAVLVHATGRHNALDLAERAAAAAAAAEATAGVSYDDRIDHRDRDHNTNGLLDEGREDTQRGNVLLNVSIRRRPSAGSDSGWPAAPGAAIDFDDSVNSLTNDAQADSTKKAALQPRRGGNVVDTKDSRREDSATGGAWLCAWGWTTLMAAGASLFLQM